VHADNIERKDVTAPRCDEVAVRHPAEYGERPRTIAAERPNPQIESPHYGRHRNTFVVEPARHGAHEVGGENRHDCRSSSSGIRAKCDFPSEKTRANRGDCSEACRQQDTHVNQRQRHRLLK